MNNPLVSIGIPIYNVEPYIEKCLLSVLDQTCQNLKIIRADDLGKDDPIEIIEGLGLSHSGANKIRIVRSYNKCFGET